MAQLTPFGLSGASERPLIVWAEDDAEALEFAGAWLEFVDRVPFDPERARVRVLGDPRAEEEIVRLWEGIASPHAYEAAELAGEQMRELLGLEGWRGALALRRGTS